MPDYDFTFKVMLLGESSSGKEDLIKRYVSGYFDDYGKLTRGVDFSSKNIDFKGKIVKLQFWDVAEEPRFRFILAQYYKGANGALILFDINNSKTLARVTEWNQTIREHAGNIPITLVGNKPILDKPREMSREEGMEIVKKLTLSGYSEISTETGKGIDRMFQDLTGLLMKNYNL
ncbi:MAG: GTP-binding protein [Promethearchaeota archaeon]|nr:MAG: GTP-binding protein [Candidatus Lokiarchaeota archaeon]